MNPSTSHRPVPRILFCSPCGPYPKANVETDPVDFFYYRNTLGQGPFQLRSFQSWYSLHFLAQNIAVPSVVLENPSMRVFQKEVLTGRYQVVAIGFTVITTGHALQMASWLKETYPSIDLILGGYGTAVFRDPDPTASLLQAKADAICFGEGVAFMRSYLHRRWGIDLQASTRYGETLRQDFPEMQHCFYRTSIVLFRQLVLLGSLGCMFGCPFCATSSQFNRKRILVSSGRRLFELLFDHARKHPEIQSAIIYDEDFLIDRHRVLEFMHLMEQCTEFQERPMLLTVFASVRSVRMYSIKELIRCGIGTIFIGVESFQTEVLKREAMRKRDGDVEELFDELHRHGINTLGSLILGWDGQTAAQMRDEGRRFAALHPTFYQVVPLHPVPGTPLWARLRRENRIPGDYVYTKDSIDSFVFELRNASRDEARSAVVETYRRLVLEGGPWPFRYAENLLRGYRELATMDYPACTLRAVAYKKLLGRILPLAIASRFLFRGRGFTARWRNVMRTGIQEFPLLSLISALKALLVAPMMYALYIGASVFFRLRPSGDQPECIRREYPGNSPIEPVASIGRRETSPTLLLHRGRRCGKQEFPEVERHLHKSLASS